jgi:hypothetical protein
MNMKKTLFLSLFSSLLFFASCSKSDDNSMHTVKYTVSSNSSMNVTYTVQDGTTKTVNGVDASWTYTFTTTAKGQIVQLIIASTNASAVSGAIFIDGQQVSQNNASGNVTISAQIP